MPYRVFIVDDNKPWARLLREELYAASFLVTIAYSLSEAKRATEEMKEGEGFDVVFLDLSLGDGQGTELLPSIARLRPRPRVALISGYLSGDRAVDLHARCDVMISKPASIPQLIKLAETLVSRVDSDDWIDGFCMEFGISPREASALRLAAAGAQNKEIADRMACAPSTIVSYWKRIFRKTRTRTRAEVLAVFIQWQSRGRKGCLTCVNRGRPEDLH